MSVRRLTPEDGPLLASWYAARGLPDIPPILWPKYGYLVDEQVAGFLMCTDSKLAYIEWLISSPDHDRISRRGALKTLIGTLTEQAAQLGYIMLGVLTENPSLTSLLTEDGFLTDSTKITSLYRRLF
jgi:hypothetical protein